MKPITDGSQDAFVTELIRRIPWVDGHADVWRAFDDTFFARLVRALADPFRAADINKVAGIEARGFILGAAVAHELNTGFVAIRKPGGLLPGAKLSRLPGKDYRGNQTELRLQRRSIEQGDRVLLVDDWFETGSQARAAKEMLEEAGADFVGAAVIVDQLQPGTSEALGAFHALIRADELGPDGGRG
jgi:adenine phosphoribosyltransferase